MARVVEFISSDETPSGGDGRNSRGIDDGAARQPRNAVLVVKQGHTIELQSES
jgi:hypothetical protein